MNETLNDVYIALTKQLYVPLVFYIPKRIWIQFNKDVWEDKLYDNLFDKVVLINSKGSNALLKNGKSIHHIVVKKERLDRNTFKLLELQNDLNKMQFQFLLNKYCTQLDFCRRMSSWFVENIREDIRGLKIENFQSFDLQQKSFEDHWDYVQDSFKDAPKIELSSNKEKLNKNDLKSFQDLIKPSGLFSGNIENEKIKKTKKEKKILVTEEEATAFLLKTVFNME